MRFVNGSAKISNSVNPDQPAPSGSRLHSLFIFICPNINKPVALVDYSL